jgi:hypothetical protein
MAAVFMGDDDLNGVCRGILNGRGAVPSNGIIEWRSIE